MIFSLHVYVLCRGGRGVGEGVGNEVIYLNINLKHKLIIRNTGDSGARAA